MSRIESKREMYELLAAGVLGNALPLWLTWKEAYNASGQHDMLAMRSVVPGREFKPNIRRHTLHYEYRMYMERNRCRPGDVIFSAMDDPTNARLWSFEVGPCNGVLHMHHSNANLLFRDAMARPRHLCGPAVKPTLRYALAVEEYDALMETMEAFPTAVVEATLYERPCGVRCSRLVTWEVRDY